MNKFSWKQWLGFGIYKKLWSLIGSRPWTFIYRDVWHNFEILMHAQWFWTAILVLWLMGIEIPLKELLVGWAIYIFGFLMGHFFWGKRYIPNQQGS